MTLEEERDAWGEQFEEEEKMANFVEWKSSWEEEMEV